MKKRLLCFMTALSMLISCIAGFTAAAQEECVITVETVQAVPGSTVDVVVSVENNPGIMGATFKVSWDDTLTLTGSECGDAFSMLSMTRPSNNKNGGNFVFYAEDIDDSDIVDGEILILTFEVSDDANFGSSYFVNLSYTSGDVFDKNLDPIAPTVNNGAVEISYNPGDVNSDTKINALDLILICRYIADDCITDPNGYNVVMNAPAADVNADNKINALDLILICRYIADDCTTDPNGYNVTLKPSKLRCNHTMEEYAAKNATCTEDGNIPYWYCTTCKNYYSDAAGTKIISLEDTVLKVDHNPGEAATCTEDQVCTLCGTVIKAAYGHKEITVSGYAPTYEAAGLTDGVKCETCGNWIKEQTEIEPLKPDEYSVTYYYRANEGTAYLQSQDIDNPNPQTYTSIDGRIILDPVEVPGYTFNGWFDKDGTQWNEISEGSTQNLILYGDFTLENYTIEFSGDMADEDSVTYNVTAAKALPIPTLDRYTWVGWSDKDGNVWKEIPKGTTGDMILYENWASHRNQAKAVKALKDPLIVEDSKNGVILFNYHIGTIENIPIHEIMRLNCVNGIISTYTVETSTEIGQEKAETIAKSISNATSNSFSWSLSNEWSDTIEISEEFLEETGLSVEEAEKIAKNESNEYRVGSSNSGTVTYSSSDESAYKLNKQVSSSATSEYSVGLTQEDKISAKTSAEIGGDWLGGKISAEVGAEVSQSASVGSTESGTVGWASDAEVSNAYTETNTSEKSWNTEEGYSQITETYGEESIATAFTALASETHKIGNSYTTGGNNETAKDIAYTTQNGTEFGSALTYFTSEINTVSKQISSTGNTIGDYRYIIAGKADVFAIVGYDVAKATYFVYTYSILDDEVKEVVDYSYDSSFTDCEISIIPFEIPYFVNDYINGRIAKTEGLVIDTETGIVEEYTRTDNEVLIVPAYVSVNGQKAVKVTGISPKLFQNHTELKGVVFSNYINEIPSYTFDGCTSLEYVVCPGLKKVGNYAFRDCTSLGEFTLSKLTTSIGKDAFENVPNVKVVASSAEVAEAAAKIKADNIILDISPLSSGDYADMTLEVSDTEYFELKGYGANGATQDYINLRVKSDATTTVINGINFVDCTRIPLEISSEDITLNSVNVASKGYAMLLTGENANVKLQGTIKLNSEGAIAVVSRNIALSPLNTSYVGKMTVTGDMLVCGAVEGEKYLTISDEKGDNDETYEIIEEEDYDIYMQGTFVITFNANGGTVSEESMVAICGSAIGELPVPTKEHYDFAGWYDESGKLVTKDTVYSTVSPVTLTAKWTPKTATLYFNANGGSVSTTEKTITYSKNYGELPTPTRDYYSFDGWYTLSDGGALVTSETIAETSSNVTVYAHWKHHEESDWVLASNVPSGAEITNRKYTYTLTHYTTVDSESTSYALSGWTQYNRTERWSDYLAWSQWYDHYIESSASRKVETQQVFSHYEQKTQYFYTRYYGWSSSNGYYLACPFSSGICLKYEETGWMDSPLSISSNSAGYTYNGVYYNHYGYRFNPSTGLYDGKAIHWYNPQTRVVDDTTKPVYKTQYRCADRYLIYTYYFYRTENLEASSYPSGNNISNINEWVRYRAK